MKGISYRPLSDMETNGVYFDENELPFEESRCQYSGLPSVKSYAEEKKVEEEKEEEYFIGHS